ncbi:MAG: arsenosugar biosynthesis radical SAM (seleno)protein ArsS [Planctomycetota bacterium]|jgi:radical SAM/Cys-rich protein
MTVGSLLSRAISLAEASCQRKLLESNGRRKPFDEALKQSGLYPLRATGIEVLQVNLGRLCNQGCRHCHVDAGPDRREVMDRRTVRSCLGVLARTEIPVLDLTGGAPEMNPHFRWLVEEARRLGRRVIDRCNLTILTAPGFKDLPEFLARNQVEIVASLPCYLKENVDAQRGNGTFADSIRALGRLNALGYGRPESGLTLTLVYNPSGPSLPPSQATLQAAYRRELQSRRRIVFNRLITITNMPIGRFLDEVLRQGHYESYMETLAESFNPTAVAGLMCRTTLSVDWRGRLHDCDFNQILELGLDKEQPQHVDDFDAARLATRPIITGQHCYGCTAGAGSGCQGATVGILNAER